MYAVNEYRSVDQFHQVALTLLLRDEAFYCIPIGFADQMRESPDLYRDAWFWTVHQGSAVIGIGWWTAPHALALSRMPEPAADMILDKANAVIDRPDGLLVPADLCRYVFSAWERLRRVEVESDMGTRAFWADRVIPPKPVPGCMRAAGENDRHFLPEWLYQFHVDCHLPCSVDEAYQMADRRLAAGNMWLWEVDATPVCMTGVAGRTPSGIRINAVYTPQEKRGRGYASNLVAGITQHQLEEGRSFCFLFTDLANPTSNSIYQRMGYRPVGDWIHRRYRV